jgi:hypothetical protein
VASPPEKVYRRLIQLYLFERPEGEFAIYIRADLIHHNRHMWFLWLLDQMVDENELVKADSNRQSELRTVYRLAAGAWMRLLREEPECQIKKLKKLRMLPL